MLFGRIFYDRIEQNWTLRLSILLDTTIFLFGPLIYSYIKTLLFNNNKPLSLIHYLPAIFHVMYCLWCMTIPVNELNNKFLLGELNLIFFIVEFLGVVLLSVYLIYASRLLKKFNVIGLLQLSYQQSVFKFSKIILITLIGLTLVWWLGFISVHFYNTQLFFFNYNSFWILAPSIIYIVGFYSLNQPQIFRMPIKINKASKKNRLKADEIVNLKKRLNYYIEEEQIYLQSDLSLHMLAKKLDTTSNNLSWLLNEIYQVNFYSYINAFRVDHFIKKIEKNEHFNHTLLGLAMECGFNSKSTFNNVFKMIMKQTPSEYVKSTSVNL